MTPNDAARDNTLTDRFDAWANGLYRLGDVMSESGFPGGSKERVNRAGNAIRNGAGDPEDVKVINTWRAAHGKVLNTFQALLRTKSRGTDVIVAQRHKRRTTIYNKLGRFPSMSLARMDDVAGCRLIFPDLATLHNFREMMHRSRFKHTRKNDVDKYDYIKQPKSTGYRGIHDVYSYNSKSREGRPYKGLLIEIQYRTAAQHAWATAVEVVGYITESQPKFQKGDNRYEYAMSLASEIIARSEESETSCYPSMSNEEVVRKFIEIDKELNLVRMLRGLNSADSAVSSANFAILIFEEKGEGSADLEIQSFRDSPDALRALFELERDFPDKDIVLVRAGSSEQVKTAFRNYFSDAREFITMIDKGCHILSGRMGPFDIDYSSESASL